MPSTPAPAHDPYAAFRLPAYRLFWTGGFVSVIGRQMLTVAVSYEIFQRTHSATALGLAGLMGALPVILLSLPAGQFADRLNRKGIILISQVALVLTSICLAALAIPGITIPAFAPLPAASRVLEQIARWFGASESVSFGPEIPLIYLLLLLNGVARAFGWAARTPFVANIVPRSALPNAVMWTSSNFEIGSIVGPAIAGFLIHLFGFSTVYLIDAVASVFFIACVWPIRYEQPPAAIHERPLDALFSGMSFVWRTKVILATITLDLFAVLLGGATALLPIFADSILNVGPVGLGWLRAAPSLGAVAMALTLAHLPPLRHAGRAMLYAVAGFGLMMVIFGLSRSFTLSLVALILSGACDNVSVVVRHTLVQLLTPDSMRGRVSAVNNIFIGSSNELGALESGLTAERFGAVVSVVAGGIGTIVAVALSAITWPQVNRIGRLHQVQAAEGQEEEREPV